MYSFAEVLKRQQSHYLIWIGIFRKKTTSRKNGLKNSGRLSGNTRTELRVEKFKMSKMSRVTKVRRKNMCAVKSIPTSVK